jgi:L-ascorbate metabolism protein UlaG (beta-lactamase superfamily)
MPRMPTIPDRELSRRLLLTSFALTAGTVFVACGTQQQQQAATPADVSSAGTTASAAAKGPVTLRWLGVAGWELAFGDRRVLIDPYLSRFRWQRGSGIDGQAPLAVNPRIVEQVVAGYPQAPEAILVTHGHWDHMSDVPYLLNRPAWSGKRIQVVANQTSEYLLGAMGTSPDRLRDVHVVQGGENLDLNGVGVTVFRAQHTQLDGASFAIGALNAQPQRPRVIGDLVDGGTLGFLVAVPGGPRILFIAATSFLPDQLAGFKPDVLVAAVSTSNQLGGYLDRLLAAVGQPRVLIPQHHDDMVTQLDDPKLASTLKPEPVAAMQAAVSRKGLAAKVIAPVHLKPFEIS